MIDPRGPHGRERIEFELPASVLTPRPRQLRGLPRDALTGDPTRRLEEAVKTSRPGLRRKVLAFVQ